jgi:hypothetical protein
METRGREEKPRRAEAAGRDANAIGFGWWAPPFSPAPDISFLFLS